MDTVQLRNLRKKKCWQCWLQSRNLKLYTININILIWSGVETAKIRSSWRTCQTSASLIFFQTCAWKVRSVTLKIPCRSLPVMLLIQEGAVCATHRLAFASVVHSSHPSPSIKTVINDALNSNDLHLRKYVHSECCYLTAVSCKFGLQTSSLQQSIKSSSN